MWPRGGCAWDDVYDICFVQSLALDDVPQTPPTPPVRKGEEEEEEEDEKEGEVVLAGEGGSFGQVAQTVKKGLDEVGVCSRTHEEEEEEEEDIVESSVHTDRDGEEGEDVATASTADRVAASTGGKGVLIASQMLKRHMT